jgi:hypothetical protein
VPLCSIDCQSGSIFSVSRWGPVIDAAETVLAVRILRGRTGRDRELILDGVCLGVNTFLFQLGNLLCSFALSLGYPVSGAAFQVSAFIRDAALICFPLLFRT